MPDIQLPDVTGLGGGKEEPLMDLNCYREHVVNEYFGGKSLATGNNSKERFTLLHMIDKVYNG